MRSALVFLALLMQATPQRPRVVSPSTPPPNAVQQLMQLATMGEPAAVLNAEEAWAGPDVLLALGRLEDQIEKGEEIKQIRPTPVCPR